MVVAPLVIGSRSWSRFLPPAGMLIPLLLGQAVAGLGGALIAVVAMMMLPPLQSWREARRRRALLEGSVPDVARVLLIALSGGEPLLTALSTTTHYVDAVVADEIGGVLRRATTMGSAAALSATTGPLGPLLSSLARAQVTGASVSDVVRGHLEEGRRERRRHIRERSQRLSIRLMIPVTLLILPGFIVMTYGPTIVSVLTKTLGRLGPVTP